MKNINNCYFNKAVVFVLIWKYIKKKTLLVASILTNILLLNTEKAFRYTNDYLDDINGRKSEVPVFIRGRTKPNRGTLNRLIRNELPTIHTKCLKKLKEKKKDTQ